MVKSLIITSIAAAVAPLLLMGQVILNPTVTPTDLSFVRNAAEINLSEVYLGELAEQNASAQPVKAFAQRMITDHTNAQHRANVFAAKTNVLLPGVWTAKDEALYARLAKLKGADFDRAYINAMVQGHTQAVDQFKQMSKSAADGDVRTFASQTLPMLESHLNQAHKTAVEIGLTSRK